jgi:hypothetical protein
LQDTEYILRPLNTHLVGGKGVKPGGPAGEVEVAQPLLPGEPAELFLFPEIFDVGYRWNGIHESRGYNIFFPGTKILYLIV